MVVAVVATNPDRSHMQNRNGTWDITGLVIRVYSNIDDNSMLVSFAATNRRDVQLNGGMQITQTAMDDLALQWLTHRMVYRDDNSAGLLSILAARLLEKRDV